MDYDERYFIEDLHGVSPKEIGKKAYNLFLMKENGFPVPSFMIIPKSSILLLFKPIQPQIDSFFKTLGNSDPPDLPLQFQNLRKEILDFPISRQTQIIKQLKKKFSEDFSVSVRSSAAVEDGNKASFAGQFKSFLNCNENNIIHYIKACVASYFSYEVYIYRKTQGILSDLWEFGIIIQEMVHSIKSGIAFSMDQTNNYADAVIVAGYGSGEGIVSDIADSDTYKIERISKTIRSKISTKKTMMTSKCEEGTIVEEVSYSNQNASVLTQREILEVLDYGLMAEALLCGPSDIEFCYDQKGKVHLLQMRLITALENKKLINLDNTNIIESYPGISSPLTFSFASYAYQIVFRSAAKSFLLNQKQIHNLEYTFANLLALFKGRIYYRLDQWYQLTGLVYKSKKALDSWKNAVGLQDEQNEQLKFNLWGKARMAAALFWMLIRHRSRVKDFYASFYSNYSLFRDRSIFLLDPDQIWDHYKKNASLLFNKWYITIINDFLAFRTFGALRNQLLRLGFPETESLANDLVSNNQEVESELALIKLLQIKSLIQRQPELLDLFHLPNQDILKVLETENYPQLTNEIDEYLDLYGDRNLAELKLETPTLRENKVLFLDLIKGQLASRVTLEQYLETKQKNRKQAKEKLRLRTGRNSFKAFQLRQLIKLSSYLIRNRENMRFARTRAFGVVKTIFLEIGRRMVSDRLLEKPEDVYFLDMEHLEKYCTHHSLSDKRSYIKDLKEKYQKYKNITLPDRIIYPEGHEPEFLDVHDIQMEDGTISGLPVSRGKVSGEAIVIDHPELDIDVRNKIIITRMTDPGWVFLMTQASGIICERGSLLSHTAIIGRELGIPVIVDIKNATKVIESGRRVSMDGSSGIITLH